MTPGRLDGVKVFSATKAREREGLGEKVTAWLRDNPGAHIIKKTVTLSSDREFHCLSIVLFWTRETATSGDGSVLADHDR
jgi:hypothetical protein